MLLDCLDDGPGCVYLMIVWFDELNVDLFFFDEILYCAKIPTVHDVKVGGPGHGTYIGKTGTPKTTKTADSRLPSHLDKRGGNVGF